MKLAVGVIGLGYWGPNYVRNFVSQEHTQIVWGCDTSDAALAKTSRLYPQLRLTKDYKEVLKDPSIDLVAIATPPKSHFEIAKAALESGKHVLLAKPLTTSSKDAEKLIKIAKKKKLLLHCDLTYIYTGAVRKMKNLIEDGTIGDLLYYDSTRTNLGLIQEEADVLWDLAVHDLAILSYCFGTRPQKISATASRHFKNSRSFEMAHITLEYANNFIAHIHVSWLSPVKIRTILVGGTKKMIYFDDVQPDEKIRIYDKGVEIQSEDVSPFRPVYRSGDILIPKVSNEEAIAVEFKEIIDMLLHNKINYSTSEMSIEIIKILEECKEFLKKNASTKV